MSSIIGTPTNMVNGDVPQPPPQPAGGPAPVANRAPPRFTDDPKSKRPEVIKTQQLVASPNAVPLEAFWRITGGDAAVAERYAPGITHPQGYMLLKPDAQTGAPLVSLQDPVAFAVLANQKTEEARRTVANGGRTVELDGPNPAQGMTVDMAGQGGNDVSFGEITTNRDGAGSGDAVEPSAVQPGDLLGSAVPSLLKGLGSAGLRQLASIFAKDGEEAAVKYIAGMMAPTAEDLAGTAGPRMLGYGASSEAEAANIAEQAGKELTPTVGKFAKAASDTPTAVVGKK